MKRTVFIPFTLMCVTGFAQISIGQYDFMPPARVFVLGFDTTPANVGPSGANQYWNFSSLQADFSSTMNTAVASWTPYVNFFPGSNLAMYDPAFTAYVQYFRNDNTGFYIQGSVNGQSSPPDLSVYTPPSKYFSWPMNYLNSFSDSGVYVSVYTSQGPNGTDTSRYVRHYLDQNLVDAWGQITTPLGTFPCLRQKKTEISIDSIFFYNSQFGTWSLTGSDSTCTIFYDWMSNDPATGFLLASVSYTNQQYSGVYWLKSNTTGMAEQQEDLPLVLYPNPASDHAGLLFPANSSYHIVVCDQLGREVMDETVHGDRMQIETGQLGAGVYIVQVIDMKSGQIRQLRMVRP